MSILKRNLPPTSALNNVKKQSKSDIFALLKAHNLKEYGVFNDRLVADEWDLNNYLDIKPQKIIGSLNNSDLAHLHLAVVKNNPTAIIEGLFIAAYFTNVNKVELILPYEDDELTTIIKNKLTDFPDYQIEFSIKYGFIELQNAKSSIIHHFLTLGAITSLLENPATFKKTTLVSINRCENKKSEPIEIEFGSTLAEIVAISSTEDIKAIVVGSRIYPPSSFFNTIIDESFPLENGLITIFNTNHCIADLSSKESLKMCTASCGKCNFCREGLIQITTILKDIINGKGNNSDLLMIKEIGEAMSFSSLCSIGKIGANFALSSLEYFSSELEAHIRRKKCPANICQAFMNIYINPVTCIGCGNCLDVCETNCIEGKPKYIHMIDEFDCIKCGKCIDICPNKSIIKTTNRLPKLPERLTRVGRFNKR